MIFVIAFLIVVHLLLVHGHDEPSTLEACLVLLTSATVALIAVVLPTDQTVTRSVPVTAGLVDQPWVERRPLPAVLGMVMRH